MSKDEVISSQQLYRTMDYDQFKALPGSRPINKSHVNYLKAKIEKKNLVQDHPLEMTKFENGLAVLDGRHRVEALRQLGYPIYYVIKPLMNSDDMIEVNTGVRPWGWKDFAGSFAERGNKNYQQFLDLYEEFGGRFRTLIQYCGTTNTHGNANGRSEFNIGDFKMNDVDISRQLLGMCDDIKEATKCNTSTLESALYAFMRTPKYDHERMVSQCRKFGEVLNTCHLMSDYLYELEQIYNSHK